MNSKIAKAFRKTAANAASQPLIYGTKGNSKSFVMIPKSKTDDELVGVEPQYAFHAGTVVVNAESARGIYKALKKAYRKAN